MDLIVLLMFLHSSWSDEAGMVPPIPTNPANSINDSFLLFSILREGYSLPFSTGLYIQLKDASTNEGTKS